MSSREKFEAWWVKGNNGCQPRSGWEELRTADGYNDEFIDMQYEGFKAAEAIFQQQLAAVVAENAGLKRFCKNAAFDADYEAELCMEQGGFTDALDEIETPATDAFLAEVRAQGVDALNIQFKKCSGILYADSVIETAIEFAAQLRQGAAL